MITLKVFAIPSSKSKKKKSLSHQAKEESGVESNDDSLVLTPHDVCKLLKCSRGTVYSALAQGTIPSIRVSPRKILIPKRRFLEWLNEGGGNNLHPQE